MTAQEYLSHKGLSVEDGYMTDLSTDTGDYLTQEEVCVLMEQYAKQRQGVVTHDTVGAKVEKIKAVNTMFDTSSGPSETTTLGIRIDGNDYIFGVYYEGPHMQDDAYELKKKTETDIDKLIELYH